MTADTYARFRALHTPEGSYVVFDIVGSRSVVLLPWTAFELAQLWRATWTEAEDLRMVDELERITARAMSRGVSS